MRCSQWPDASTASRPGLNGRRDRLRTEAAAPVQAPFDATQPVGGQSARGEDETRIIADTVTNSPIIHATPQQYEAILQTIGQLDLLPRQVLVDARIHEVDLDDSLSFGVTAMLQNRQTLGVSEGK